MSLKKKLELEFELELERLLSRWSATSAGLLVDPPCRNPVKYVPRGKAISVLRLTPIKLELEFELELEF